MSKLTKRMKTIREKVEAGKLYSIQDAVALLKEVSQVRFDETVEVAINLGIDTRKSDQTVRGAAVLPNGTGKTVRVAVFAQGENADAAKEAGADIVGFEDLADEIKGGRSDFDVVIATPDAMRVVGQLGQILGPRGLMPNPKVGTVTADVRLAVTNAKAGQVRFRADKAGVLHAPVGKLAFADTEIKQNLEALLAEVNRLRPAAAKGIYIKKISLSSTMGPGLQLDPSSLETVK